MVGIAEETVNETKPSWLNSLVWPVVGVALAVSVLGAMTIGLYVLPLAIAVLFALLVWGGNRGSSVGLISIVGLPFLSIAFLYRHGPSGMVCRPYKDGGQQCAQEYSPWPLLIIGTILVLLGVLLFIRLRSISAMSSRSKGFWALILVISVIITKLAAAPSSLPPMATDLGSVQQAFQQISLAVAKKEGVHSLSLTPVRADVISYPDGSKVTLWVPNPASLGIRSDCFYVEQPRKGGASGYIKFSCAVPKAEVILDRQGSIVVGFIRFTKAPFATITSNGVTLKVPITFGYFLFPSALSEDSKARFTISFIDPGGASCQVDDLPAPGSSASIECVIA